MWKFAFLALGCVSCITWNIHSQDAARSTQPADAKADEAAAVKESLKGYTDVFNKHDAKALAAYWTENAVSIDTESGSRTQGRAAIEAAFHAYFKENPQSNMTVQLNHHRYIKPDVLSIEGTSTVTNPQDDPAQRTFTAVLIKQDGKWLVDQAQESPKATSASGPDALASLSWLVGAWQDDSKDVNVETQIKWSAQKTFLIRKYSVRFADNSETQEGTQIIGWDPRGKLIRSWVFGSDGSFGEGTWAQSGDEWRVKFNHVNTDGSVLSGMQIITKLNNDSATVQMIGQDLDGEPQPSTSPVKIIRKTNAASTRE